MEYRRVGGECSGRTHWDFSEWIFGAGFGGGRISFQTALRGSKTMAAAPRQPLPLAPAAGEAQLRVSTALLLTSQLESPVGCAPELHLLHVQPSLDMVQRVGLASRPSA